MAEIDFKNSCDLMQKYFVIFKNIEKESEICSYIISDKLPIREL